MPRFDEFDLDVKLGDNNGSGDGDKITSVAICTPGTCNKKCPETAWLCTNVCVTKTCLTCA